MSNHRLSNFELYRIIVMLAIVAHHYVVNSGIMDVMEEYPLSGRSIYYYLFGAWGKVGINCFVLITGYFMCTSQITVQKFLKLFFEVLFYRMMIHGIFMLSGYEAVNLNSLFLMLIPISNVKNDFGSCFLLFYLCIPFLNILIRNMSQKQHMSLIILLLSISTGLGTLYAVVGRFTTNYVSWFCVLYFISSYIRLYKPWEKVRWSIIVGGGRNPFGSEYISYSCIL